MALYGMPLIIFATAASTQPRNTPDLLTAGDLLTRTPPASKPAKQTEKDHTARC
jgi:hypothetical protein